MSILWHALPLAEVNLTSLGHFNPLAIAFFVLFVASSLGITYWAARLTKNTAHFYTAGGNISGLQNGLALAGDFMSAASFLGITGLVALNGFDGLIYSIGFLVGWPIVTHYSGNYPQTRLSSLPTEKSRINQYSLGILGGDCRFVIR